MANATTTNKKEAKKTENTSPISDAKPDPSKPEWTDYVLSLLTEDERLGGNPTTDGLRRIFEIALNCTILDSISEVVQSPSPENEKRATVVHKLSYYLNVSDTQDHNLNYRSVSGSADVYWGNCDKIYRNHPVAVAETRAEGRALRRGLRLRKVVAAEELAKDIEDDVNGNSVSKISNNQINFIDVIAKRIDIDVIQLLKSMNLAIDNNNIYNLNHDDAVSVITKLGELQRNSEGIDSQIKGYNPSWK